MVWSVYSSAVSLLFHPVLLFLFENQKCVLYEVLRIITAGKIRAQAESRQEGAKTNQVKSGWTMHSGAVRYTRNSASGLEPVC